MTHTLTPELEEFIVSGLEAGLGLRKIVRDNRDIPGNKDFPSRETILKWQRDNEAFYSRCTRAREAAGLAAADELDELNQMLRDGLIEHQVANIISNNLRWKASKLASKVYGDKQHIDHSGTITLSALVEQSYQITSDKTKIIDITPSETQDID